MGDIVEFNPHQRIMIDGQIIQAGRIDTLTRFEQLMAGVDLNGKTFLDVGCNLGMMTSLAAQRGAEAKGIDINLDYIEQAQTLFPELSFECQAAQSIFGKYDIVLASAMLHYIPDLDGLLKLFARCAKMVMCDVWIHPSQVPIFALTSRGIFVPSKSAFLAIAGKYFGTIEDKGLALSPDDSERRIFHLSDPHPVRPRAVIISGDGATGKTTLAETYHGYKVIHTDEISVHWYRANRSNMYSVKWTAELARGSHSAEFIGYYIGYLEKWLTRMIGHDVAIEGYDLLFDDLRLPIINFLIASGWDVDEIRLEKYYPKDYT